MDAVGNLREPWVVVHMEGNDGEDSIRNVYICSIPQNTHTPNSLSPLKKDDEAEESFLMRLRFGVYERRDHQFGWGLHPR